MSDIDDRINMIIAKYKPDIDIEIEDKKTVIIILNEIRNKFLDFYTRHDTFSKLIKKYSPERLDKVLSQY